MRKKACAIPALILLAVATLAAGHRAAAQNQASAARPAASLPPGATRCDIMLPLYIDLQPLGDPAVGRPARFEVRTESWLDPDLVQRSWIEYVSPQQLRRAGMAERRDQLGREGRGRTEWDMVFPAEDRYEIRARLVVQLIDGKTISQTAVRWIELGAPRPPEGMLGRVVDSNGAGIRVYRGVTVKN